MRAYTSLLSFIFPINLSLLCRRRLDIQNERLPEFNPDIAPTMFSGPSMRRGSTDSGMELLIKKTLEEEGEEGGVVERIAEKIARGRRITERPAALKRHGTA
jgi:serine/threonine-protein phosphatase 2B catalytic subunit